MRHAVVDGKDLFPTSIWSFQTDSLLSNVVTDSDKAQYPLEIKQSWPAYLIRWNIQDDYINFMVDFGAPNGWFGMVSSEINGGDGKSYGGCTKFCNDANYFI